MTLASRLIRSSAIVSFLALIAVPLGAQTTTRHRAVAPPSNLTVTISGIISDATTGQPIAGADAAAEGHKSALTGNDGKYTLKITRGRNVAVTAEHFAYNPSTLSVFGQDGATANFSLTPKPTVSVKLMSGDIFILDLDSSQFAYLIPFSGYIRGDVGNFCKDDGTSITPDKHDIRRVTGPAQPVNFSTCCTIGPIMKANLEMKSGEKLPVYFNDSCFGYEVDFLGREKSSGVYQYFRFTEIAEIVFP